MNKKYQYPLAILAFFSFILIGFSACTNDKDDDPKVEAPSTLVYSPNAISTTAGTAVSSSAPTVGGTAPFTYTATVSPANSNITINENTGMITANASTAEGTYKVNVTAKNSAGSKDFASALTITVTAAGGGGNKITFNGNVKSIIQAKCAPCHVSGGGNTNYTVYASAKGNVDGIINRINRNQGTGGFMPQGGAKLPSTELSTIAQWKTDGLLEN